MTDDKQQSNQPELTDEQLENVAGGLGRENSIECIGIVSPRDTASGQATGIVSPRDPASGQATGKIIQK